MASKMENPSFSSTAPVVKDDSIRNSASTITNDNRNDAATAANATSNNNISDNTEDNSGIFLRWSRITKSVTIKTDGSGLLRGSIAAPTEDLGFHKVVRKQLSQFSLSSTTIWNTDRQKKNTKTILDEVSGYAAPGEILAMMGPSGSGKTSLLNCLSGRNPYNLGVVSVNGKPLGGSDMKRLMAKIAYVKQADIFFEHLTVRDQLGYTAMMRLPEKWTKQEKINEVEKIIQLLRLTKVAGSKIQTLSGGEKKRVNIGTELLTDPDVLLLDEPTSGLDSTSAVALIRMLQKLARNSNKTIITSIHQPSSALFQSFDRLIMLAEGRVMYFGRPKDSLNYLREQKLDCPDGYNLADYWMDLLVQDSAIEGGNDTDNYEYDVDGSYRECVINSGSSPSTSSSTVGKDISIDNNNDNEYDDQDGIPVNKNTNTNTSSYRLRQDRNVTHFVDLTKRQQLIRAWDGEAVAEQMDLLVEQAKTYRLSLPLADTKNEPKNQVSKYNTTWGLQYRTLVHRSLKNSRSAIFTPINLVKSCALGLLSGLLWFQMDYSESRIFDRSSYFFFTMTFWVFDAMFQSFLMFPAERAVVLKERASGSYKLSAYFMGKTTSEMPARLALPLIYMVISFWMAAISDQFSMFVATTCISLLSVMAGEAIGLLVGATIYDVEKGMTVMTIVSLFLALVGGFFVQIVPPFLVWSKYLSPFKYSFDASLQLVFDKPVPCDGSGVVESICRGNEEGTISPEEVLDFLGVQGSVGFNVGILIAIGLVPRYLAYLALRGKKEGDR